MKKSTSPSKPANPQSKNSNVVKTFKARLIGGEPCCRIEVHSPQRWSTEGEEDIVAPSVYFLGVREFNPGVIYLADKELATTLRSVADLIDSIAAK